MLNKSQDLISGKNSTNLQADLINYSGLSYHDCKEIFVDLFKANYPILLEDAGRIAKERAEYILNKFFVELFNRAPQMINKFNQPDIQCDLLTILREYARQGKTEIGDLLVELMVNRVLQNDQNVLQINLIEALSVVPKLTCAQMDILTIALLSKLKFLKECNHYTDLIAYLKDKICPFGERYQYAQVNLIHLEYLRCIYKMHAGGSPEPITSALRYNTKFMRWFSNGATLEQIKERFGDVNDISKILIKSCDDPAKYHLVTYDQFEFDSIIQKYQISSTKNNDYYFYFTCGSAIMYESNIQVLLKECLPCLNNVFMTTEQMTDYELYPLGVVIAQANYKRRLNEDLDISDLIV